MTEIAAVRETLGRLEANQVAVKEDLKEHIRRTANLEGRAETIEKYIHQDRAIKMFLTKTIGILALAATIAGAIIAYFK